MAGVGSDTSQVAGVSPDTSHVTGVGSDISHMVDVGSDTLHMAGVCSDTSHWDAWIVSRPESILLEAILYVCWSSIHSKARRQCLCLLS